MSDRFDRVVTLCDVVREVCPPFPSHPPLVHWRMANPAVERLTELGASFRNPMVSGPGGKQVLLLDPSGNVVELFEPAG